MLLMEKTINRLKSVFSIINWTKSREQTLCGCIHRTFVLKVVLDGVAGTIFLL